MLQKIKYKLKNKVFAIFLNEKGEQIDIKKIKINENSFNYKDGTYFYDVKKYPFIEIVLKSLFSKIKGKYFFYIKGISEPISFSSKFNHINPRTKKPYIAEDFYTLLEAKHFKQINGIEKGLFNLEPKQLLIITGVIFAIIYLISNGGLQ